MPRDLSFVYTAYNSWLDDYHLTHLVCGGHTRVGSERGGEATLEGEGKRRNMKCKAKRLGMMEESFFRTCEVKSHKVGILVPLLKC